MPSKQHKPLHSAILIALLGATAISAPLQAAIQEKVSVSAPNTLTPTQEHAVTSAAAKVMRHVAQARADISKKDTSAAKEQLNKADTLLNIIEASLPTAVVKDRIWVAKKHLEYEDSQQVIPDLIPIYSSLDELLDYMPVSQAKQHLDKAKAQLDKNNKEQAAQELQATDAALLYTQIDMPLSATRQQVAAARTALSKGQLKDADKALKTAEDNVIVMSVDVDEPLIKANASIWRSGRDYAAGAYEKASAGIQQSINYLQQAAKSGDKTTRLEAEKLIKQTQGLESMIQERSADTGAALHSLWQRTQALSERSLAFLSTGVSRLSAASEIKADLIEAKLHLAYADIDRFTAKDTRQAQEELKQADKYLGQALKHADASDQQQIDQMQKAARKLSVKNDKTDKAGEQQYSLLQNELRELIQTL